MLSTPRLLDELVEHTAVLADAVRATDPAAPVASCPGWTMRDLADHVGGVHRWASAHVGERREKLVRRDRSSHHPVPSGSDELASWLRDGPADLAGTVRAVDEDVVVGGFGSPVPVRFWARRQCHETLVHRGDAEIGAGRSPWADVAPEAAADAVDEWLELILLGAAKRTALHGTGETLHLHVTDGELGDDGEWVITREQGGLTVEHGHRKADVALRGPARVVLGVATARLDPSAAEVLGDASLLEHWLTHAVV